MNSPTKPNNDTAPTAATVAVAASDRIDHWTSCHDDLMQLCTPEQRTRITTLLADAKQARADLMAALLEESAAE